MNSYLDPNLSHFFQIIFTGGLAYLDPGSGSFILQILIATLVGGMFIVKTYWQRILGFFRKKFSKRGGDDTE